MKPDHCPACRDLYAECGEALFPLYSKKLLTRGWAGVMSRVERAYVRAHKPLSERQLAALSVASRRLQDARRTARNTDSDGLDAENRPVGAATH